MTKFFTSDTHFFHKNIIAYCDRPFNDIEHMNQVIVDNWNSLVGPTDVVYHLGDVLLGDSSRWDEVMQSLNGYKVLTIGNHDRVFAGMPVRQQNKWEEKYMEWFDEVIMDGSVILSDGTVVNVSHFPYTGDSQAESRYDDYRMYDHGVPIVHGHTHAVFDPLNPFASRVSFSEAGTRQIHVGQDAWHFRPVHESEVIELLSVEV